MNKNLIFFDIDGTLLPEGQETIPTEVVEHVNRLSENNEVLICTGRCRNQAINYVNQINQASFICSNGQDVVYQGEQVYKNVFSDEDKEKMKAIFGNKKASYGYETTDRIYLPEGGNSVELKDRLHTYGILDVQISSTNISEDVFQFWAFGNKADVDIVASEVKAAGFHFMNWGDEVIEILPGLENKAKGIEILKGHLNSQGMNVTTYAFGDGVNDIEMLAYVDYSVAMGNAHEETKKVATHVSTNCDDNGIINGINKLGLI